MSAVLLLCLSLAAEAAPVLSVSYRALLGASVRLEAPVGAWAAPFGELGLSAWVLPGDDPRSGQGSVPLLRSHGKLGVDLGPVEGGLYLGPRVVVADLRTAGGVDAWELGVLGTVGYKAWGRSGTRTQLGIGGGLHRLQDWDGAQAPLLVPLPHAELRFAF